MRCRDWVVFATEEEKKSLKNDLLEVSLVFGVVLIASFVIGLSYFVMFTVALLFVVWLVLRKHCVSDEIQERFTSAVKYIHKDGIFNIKRKSKYAFVIHTNELALKEFAKLLREEQKRIELYIDAVNEIRPGWYEVLLSEELTKIKIRRTGRALKPVRINYGDKVEKNYI